ncbi:MAG: amino acid adenylation domain-containing protein [Rhodococcus sp. (in: high G+C Gram-positive bacteria)]
MTTEIDTPGESKIIDILPLTPLQTGMYLQSSIAPTGDDPYLSQTVVTFASKIEPGRLDAALTLILTRYPNVKALLRQRKNGDLVWVVPRASEPVFTRVDGVTWDEFVRRDRASGFEFFGGPLVRFALSAEPEVSKLLITYHHALMDGWSEAIFVDELIEAYRRGASAPLDPAPSFKNFLGWTANRDHDEARRRWARYLDGVEGPTLVARQRATAATEARGGSRTRLDVEISDAVRGGVTAVSREHGVTTNVVVQAAWALTLADLTGRDDVTFGMAVSLRPFDLDGASSMVGLMLNSVPVRVKIHDSDRSGTIHAASDLLSRLQSDHIELEEFRFLGPADIAGTTSFKQLFDSIVVYQNYPSAHRRDDGVATSVEIFGAHMSFPMALIVGPDPELWAFVIHDDRFVSARTAARYAQTFAAILRSLTSDSGGSSSRLLPEHSESSSTGPSRDVPSLERMLTDRFAESSGDIALVVGDTPTTYAQLEARVVAVSGELRRRGIGVESRVAIALPRGVDMVAALLATLDVGASFVPIDVRYPIARIRHMLADSGHDVVVIDDSAPIEIVDSHRAVRLSPTSLSGEPHTDRAFSRWVPPEAGAYLVYTSGSTGAPKGVLGTRASLANRLEWAVEAWGRPRNRLAKSSFSFIDGATELLTGLLAGQQVVLAQDADHADAAALSALVSRSGAQQITAVGSLAAVLAETAGEQCSSLTSWVLSGEPLRAATIEAIRRSTPDADIVNSYGSSEVAGDVATEKVGVEPDSIGVAVANTAVWLFDAFLRPVREGIAGEIYVGGVQVARGYVGNFAETALRFVADPNGTGERVYRTGDRARMGEDGRIEFLGRDDRQVKVRGHRVELGEVEGATAAAPSVTDCAVVAAEGPQGGAVLIAYVTPAEVDPDRVHRVVRDLVPDYLTPAYVVPLRELPRTPNGKVDRLTLAGRGLPDRRARTSRSPSTDGEKRLAELFATCSHIGDPASLGVDDDFFALGGDSITSITLVYHARRSGLFITTADVFECRTIARLAERAESGDDAPVADSRRVRDLLDVAETAELRERGIDTDLARPATPLQQGLVFQSVAAGDGVEEIYVIATEFEVCGELDSNRLEGALAALTDRHPALRSRFVTLRTGRTVAIHDRTQVALRRYTVELFDSAAARALLDDERRTFDIESDSLIRVLVLDRGTNVHRVVFTLHHLLVDGWSVGTVGTELFKLYRGRELPAAANFDDYLLWLDRRDHAASIEAWRAALGSNPTPTMLSTSEASASRTRSCEITLPFGVDATARFTAAARRRSVTSSELINAAWGIVLSGFTGADSVLFGSTVSGRPADLDGVADTVGLFINTVPVKVDVGGGATVSSVLARVRDFTVAVAAHHHVGLADIQKAAGARTLFDTLVVFENFAAADTSGIDTEGIATEGIDSEDFSVSVSGFHTVTHYPLTLTVFPGDTMSLVVEYRPDLVSESSARAVASGMRTVLAAFVGDGDPAISSIPLMDDDGIRRATSVLAGKRLQYPGGTLLDVFAECVRDKPDVEAVRDSSESLTFAEFDRLTNRVARGVISARAKAEDVVAVFVPRTAASLAAIVGVMKSGAAYLPIDPEWPSDRIRQILREARPVLTIDERTASAMTASQNDAPITDSERAAPLHPDHPAYVIYTSGTTGTPKGVVVPHRGLSNLFHSHRDNVHTPTATRGGRSTLTVAHAWSMAFDASWQPQLWMFGGHTLHLIDQDTVLDPAALVKYLTSVSADFIEVVPSLLEQMLRVGSVDTLSSVGVGGEAVSQELWNRLRATDGLVAYNFYGPTEATVDAVFTSTELSEEPVIGRPVTNLFAYVLDRSLRLTPTGVLGELYLAGPGLARGYRDDSPRTASRFVADPFGADGGRLYRTGDLVAWTEEGTLRYGGRADDQVKIRGHRVELGEVEARLRSVDGIADARVVVPSEDRATLAAYVVPDGGVLDPSAIRARMREVLPTYMVPATVTVLERFPVTASGKLDVAALPAPASDHATGRAPTSDIEHLICNAAASVLHIPALGADDDFFDHGGDSIMAMELSARLRADNFALSPRDVVLYRTAERLAHRAVSGVAEVRRTAAPHGVVPATPIVRWVDQLGGSIDEISQSVLLSAPTELTESGLIELLEVLVARHPVLNSRFERHPGAESVFTVLPEAIADVTEWISIDDVDGLTDAELGERVTSESRAARGRLNPGTARMVDVCWLRGERTSGSSGELLLTLHHLVVDGVSWRVLLPDLTATWRRMQTGVPHEPGAVGTSFRDWAHEIHRASVSDAVVAETEYWSAITSDATPIPLLRPVDHSIDVGKSVKSVSFTLTPGETAVLLTASQATLSATVEHVLMATFAAAAAVWCGVEEADECSFVVDVEGHGRTGATAEGIDGSTLDGSTVVGWLTAIYPLRLTATARDHRAVVGESTKPDVALAALRRITDGAARSKDSVPGDGSSYGMLRWLHPDIGPELARQRAADIEFNYLGRFDVMTGGDFGASTRRSSLDSSPGDSTPCDYALIVDSVVHDSVVHDSVVDGGGSTGSGASASSVLEATLTWPDGVLDAVEDLAGAWHAALSAACRVLTGSSTHQNDN